MNVHRTRYSPAALSALALTLVLTACQGGGGAESADQPKSPTDVKLVVDTPVAKGPSDEVTWNLGTEPPSLDWVYGYDYPPNTVLSNVCESLMRIGSDFKAEPNLAEKVDHPDSKTFVYTIRQGVKFHDGTTMTAEDVAYSLERHQDDKVGSYWSTAYANVASVEVTGAREVTVKLTKPDALFNELMAVPPGVVGSKASIEKLGDKFGTPDGGLNCTGPYRLNHWSKGQSIKLKKFDGYWDAPRAARTGQVEFVFIEDTNTSLNAAVSGAVDGGYGVSATSLDKLKASKKGKIYWGPTTSTISLVVADFKGPLADPKIRKALSLAIDREAFVKTAYAGYGEPSKAVAAKFTWGDGETKKIFEEAYRALPSVDQNIEEAKNLVAQAGKPSRPVVIAAGTGGSVNPLIGTEVQAAGKRIGLDIQIKAIAPDAYGGLFGDPKAREGIDLFHTSWYADIAEPLQVYQNWHSKSFANYGGYSDPAYDKLIEDALAQEDPVKRASITARAQQTVSEELLWIPLAQVPNSVFINNRITGAPATNAYLYYPWAASIGSAK